MITQYILSDYVVRSDKGYVCTEKFYDLSLAGKYEIVRLLEEVGLFKDYKLYERVVKGIIQHSSPELKRTYNVKGERKQRPPAKRADELEALQALYLNWDKLMPLIMEHAEGRFQTYVALGQGDS